jgi:uncharacterized protein (DUF885 family)
MTTTRRDLLAAAGAAGLTALAAGPARAATLDQTFDGIAEGYLKMYPELATSYGYDKGARAALRSRLSDRSLGGVAADAAFCKDKLAALSAFPDAKLSAQDKLDKQTIAYALQLGIDGAAFDFGDNTLNAAMSESAGPYVVSQNTGAYAAIPEFLDSQHLIETPADADAYVARMHGFAIQLSQETDRIARDTGQGVIAPSFILSNALGQQEALLATPATQARLVSSLARRTKSFDGGGKYEATATAIVEKEIYPALAKQHDSLKAAQAKANDQAGVWKLAHGDVYYDWCLRVGTSTTLTADQIHKIGLEQNKAIEAEMDALLKANGMTKGSVGERMAALSKDPKYLFEDSDKGRAQLLDYLNGVIADVRPHLSEAFNLKMKAPVQVKRVPVDIQDGAGQGYMNFGAVDGSRPSIYYINLKSMGNWPRFGLKRDGAGPCLAGRLPDRKRQGAHGAGADQRLQRLCRGLCPLCRAASRRDRDVQGRLGRAAGLPDRFPLPRRAPGGGHRPAFQALDPRAGGELRHAGHRPRQERHHQRDRPLLRLARPGLRLQDRPDRDRTPGGQGQGGAGRALRPQGLQRPGGEDGIDPANRPGRGGGRLYQGRGQ